MASPAAAITADPGASPAPAAAPITGTPAAVTPASPAGISSTGGPLPSAAESQNIRQLREAYETLKKEYEPYKAFGKPEEIQSRVDVYQKMYSTAIEIGTALGYSEQEVQAALSNDPAGTIAFLRQEQIKAEQNGAQPDIKKILSQELDKRLKPFEQEREQMRTEKAQKLFDTAFDQKIAELYKDDKLTGDELDLMYEASVRLLERDQNALNELKSNGKTAAAAEIITQAKTFLDKYYLARVAREQKRIGGTPPPPGNLPSTKRFTLDDAARGNFPTDMKFVR
jgi:hypothetical protein